MRTVVKLSSRINKDEALALLDEYSEFIEDHTGIKCEWYLEQHDFSYIPTVPDADGDLKPTYEYRKNLLEEVHSRYGDNGTDNVVLWIHEDEFFLKGIWGVNYSINKGNSYSLQICRWDKDNSANSFGTLYHEQMHSFDAVIKRELGIDIEPEFGGDWDKFAVHGGRPDEVGVYKWDYVRYKENTVALMQIADRLKRAYAIRKDRHLKKIGLMKQLVALLSTLVGLLAKRK